MSDTLIDMVSHWLQHLQIILPVGAIILVIVLYSCVLGSSPQPQLILADESVCTKKEKALAKKRLKQQQVKKQKPSNGHVVEAVRPQPSVQTAKVKDKSAETKRSNKAQDKKSAMKDKVLQKSAPVKDAKVEAALAASRQERAQMKKEALQGEWVTVVSGKEKKAKQAQIAAEESEKLAELDRQSIIEEAQRLTEEVKNTKAGSQANNKSNTDSSIKSAAADNPTKGSKSKNSKKSGQKSEDSPTSNIPVSSPSPTAPQPDVRPKDPKPVVVSSAGPSAVTPQPTGPESDKSLQEKIAEAMQPAFDELGEWEEAKPLKMKNVKKRARRDK